MGKPRQMCDKIDKIFNNSHLNSFGFFTGNSSKKENKEMATGEVVRASKWKKEHLSGTEAVVRWDHGLWTEKKIKFRI